jgi:Avidin family
MHHPLSGIWYNQHGSRLELEVSEGALSGSFTSTVGFRRTKGESAKVLGFRSGNLVSFVANFEPHGSLTAWAGHVIGDGPESAMELQWQMTVALPGRESPDELWRGIWVGSDVFRRQLPMLAPDPRHIASHVFPDWP